MTDLNETTSVDDTLYGIAEVSRDFLSLERRRTKFLVWSIVIALLMNVGWLVVGVIRDRSRTQTIDDLAASVADLSSRNDALADTQRGLEQTVQAALDQKIILEELKNLQRENNRSLDCVALFVSNQPSKSPSCDDVNKRLRDLIANKPIVTTTTTRPVATIRTTTTTTRVTTTTTPRPTTTTTTPPCRGINLLGICIGG